MENINFYYDFEISKQGLNDCLNEISNYGDATIFYVQMGLASLTLLENAYKGIVFNFQENSLTCVNQLCTEIYRQLTNKLINEKSYLTYLQLLGAYLGWCVVKKYKAYFATVNNQKLLIHNNKAYNPTLIIKMCCEQSLDIISFFNEL